MRFKEVTDIYCENNKKSTNILRGQNAELVNNKAGGTHNYHSALKG
jgi:hypothetical protein